MRRQFVSFPGGELNACQRYQFHADFRAAAGAIDQACRRDGLAPGSADRIETFARRQTRGDDVFHHQHGLVFRQFETAAQLKLAVLTLDIHGGQSELPAHLITRHDAADGGRNDRREFLLHLLAHFGRQRLAQFRRALRILEYKRLLQENIGMQSGRKDEMSFQKRARLFEFPQNLFRRHVLTSGPVCGPRRRSTEFDRRVHA